MLVLATALCRRCAPGVAAGIGSLSAAPLSRVDLSPELAELKVGERLLLVEPGEIVVPAIVRPVEAAGFHFWYAVLESRAVIHDLGPDKPVLAE